jgi:retinol dehydrogenase-12
MASGITRNCLITGGTNGIGRVTALTMAKAGMRVFIVARNQAKAEAVRTDMIRESGNGQIELLIGDLENLADVKKVAREFLAKKIPLHLLINNAGVVNGGRQLTKDGFEGMFGVNHLAPFLLTLLLLEALKAGAPARIVNVASDAHRFVKGLDFNDLQSEHGGFPPMKKYGASKLCNIYFTRELARRIEGSGVTVNAVHPGWVATGLGGQNGFLGKVLMVVQKPFARSPEKGAACSIYVATSPELEGISGRYYFDGKEHRPSRAGCDDAAAQRLWKISEELCGVHAA